MSFSFKQFTVEQDRCAMKVGTDGVLLGSWTSLENNPQTILDIGAGTGLIALMLAQRSAAEQIDAIEIDENAYEQCVENFENSPWADRLFCFHASLDEFADEPEDEKYDLIVSNPPFFVPNEREVDLPENRKKARFYDSLPFEDLVTYASQLLSENGELVVVIPFAEEEHFITFAKTKSFFANRITRVRGTETASIKRSLLQFSFVDKPIDAQELVLEISRHHYTDEFKELVKDFYLKL
ncbi:tRNA1(Val) (adenine(37)-N6)-methyltransferase [Planktosalinus lacus]|uniref:tRNA1(Val) (adenine(37)-N6)-methyltransferase n=1 Tax=Planktosalinus lacus TaxID=1526573 RepID=A0A8J2Y953_9FLAO|nr:methyltransferase [Planktosalinus lacus]GGD90432.1 tRNA1(Val) (adenine(37)-N6)-methyltransferase [Planktosalinus lacus]